MQRGTGTKALVNKNEKMNARNEKMGKACRDQGLSEPTEMFESPDTVEEVGGGGL